MNKKFLHIGIGRTSNITLINEIYPIIAELSNYSFFHSNEYIKDQININYEKMKLKVEIDNEINFNENTIISDERLIGWNPYDWKKFAEANLRMFGKDATVLIVLRDPYEYINSMYTRQCLVHGNLMLPNEYYLLNKNFNRKNDKTFFLQDFSYEKLKKIYEEKFNKVIFLDYNDIKKMDFFANYFKLNLNDKEKLKSIYESVKLNKSYSSLSCKLTLILYKLLKIPSFFFKYKFVKKKFKELKIISTKKKIHNKIILDLNIKQIENMTELDIKHNFYSKMINLLKWQKIMFVIDKVFKSQKFDISLTLEKEKIDIINQCKKEYQSIIQENNQN